MAIKIAEQQQEMGNMGKKLQFIESLTEFRFQRLLTLVYNEYFYLEGIYADTHPVLKAIVDDIYALKAYEISPESFRTRVDFIRSRIRMFLREQGAKFAECPTIGIEVLEIQDLESQLPSPQVLNRLYFLQICHSSLPMYKLVHKCQWLFLNDLAHISGTTDLLTFLNDISSSGTQPHWTLFKELFIQVLDSDSCRHYYEVLSVILLLLESIFKEYLSRRWIDEVSDIWRFKLLSNIQRNSTSSRYLFIFLVLMLKCNISEKVLDTNFISICKPVNLYSFSSLSHFCDILNSLFFKLIHVSAVDKDWLESMALLWLSKLQIVESIADMYSCFYDLVINIQDFAFKTHVWKIDLISNVQAFIDPSVLLLGYSSVEFPGEYLFEYYFRYEKLKFCNKKMEKMWKSNLKISKSIGNFWHLWFLTLPLHESKWHSREVLEHGISLCDVSQLMAWIWYFNREARHVSINGISTMLLFSNPLGIEELIRLCCFSELSDYANMDLTNIWKDSLVNIREVLRYHVPVLYDESSRIERTLKHKVVVLECFEYLERLSTNSKVLKLIGKVFEDKHIEWAIYQGIFVFLDQIKDIEVEENSGIESNLNEALCKLEVLLRSRNYLENTYKILNMGDSNSNGNTQSYVQSLMSFETHIRSHVIKRSWKLLKPFWVDALRHLDNTDKKIHT